MKKESFQEVHIDDLLRLTIGAGCRELCLRAGRLPYMRSCGGSPPRELLKYEAPTALDVMQMIYAVLTDEQILRFEREGELTFPYAFQKTVNFDVLIIRSGGAIEADFVVKQGEP